MKLSIRIRTFICICVLMCPFALSTFLRSHTNTDTNAKIMTENLLTTSNFMMFSSSTESPEEQAKMMESVVIRKPIKVESRMVIL
jgi:hypothetical protein